MPNQQFQKALGRLVNDEAYRTTIEANPKQLLSDYSLNQDELRLLMSVWEATGTASDVRGYADSPEWYEYCCCCCCC